MQSHCTSANMYQERTLSTQLRLLSGNFKVLLLTGMRQVGKTTLLEHLAQEGRHYVTLDDPSALMMAKKEPHFFLQTYPPPVLIDEIQYAPELFIYIKMLADQSNTYGLVWMTGSQQFLLMQSVTETLAGRIAIAELRGYSLYERESKGLEQRAFVPTLPPPCKLMHRSLLDTFHTIWQGSFPRATELPDAAWEAYYEAYVKTYIERDVRALSQVGDEMTFYRFLRVMAARTGQELNFADIAQDVDVSPNTIKHWVSILEASGIIYLLRPYYANVNKRFIKSPKVYFWDAGLCCFLAGWTSPGVLLNGSLCGAMFETFAVTEILKSYLHTNTKASFYFYRTVDKVEVDLLIERNNQIHPIEIKMTAAPRTEMIQSFSKLALGRECTLAHGTLICLCEHYKPLSEHATAISIWDI